MSLNEGDWIDGKVEWWWKYVIPGENQFWAAILAQNASVVGRQGPDPVPWRQAIVLGFEAVAMLQAATNISDVKERAKLLSEVVEKFSTAAQRLKPEAAGAMHG
jgi:hypothetical protein